MKAKNKQSKYVIISGGVTSSLGKGIVSASLAKLLQARGLKVTIIKLDPYINVDPGTLNPYEHGEVYVTHDGAETDLDLGHYERFLNIRTTKNNNFTTGRVYQTVIEKERKGEYLGKTVQVIPHITDEIKRRIRIFEKDDFDIILVEIGGTVGDIESLPYIEAIRQLQWELGKENVSIILLTLIPYLKAAGELKTKPTQHSVKFLMQSGIQPDILVCRTEKPLSEPLKEKIALFTNVKKEAVIESRDVDSIYEVPLLMKQEGLDKVVLENLGLKKWAHKKPNLKQWIKFLDDLKNPKDSVHIALVGKYIQLRDAYKSIHESLIHGAAYNHLELHLHWIDSEKITEENIRQLLSQVQGILIAPGFGSRGIEGKIKAIQYARENQIPMLGICFGMQMTAVEFARNVLGFTNANSTEIDPSTPYPVIDLLPEQLEKKYLGGTLRLGAKTILLKENSLIHSIYQTNSIEERHRHRYFFNEKYKELYEKNGMIVSGVDKETGLTEVMEYIHHPWFVTVQFHPEYQSTVDQPHPLFISFIHASYTHAHNNKKLIPENE